MKYVFFIRQCLNQECHCRYPVGTDTEVVKYCVQCGSETELSEYIHYPNNSFSKKTNFLHLELVSDNLRSAWNVGSLFRTCDGVGVSHFHLTGISPTPQNLKVAKTSLRSEQSMPWSYSPNSYNLVRQLKEKGYTILALEKNDKSVSLDSELIKKLKDPICLVCGNEKWGVDPEILAMADFTVALPMVGQKESLNVAVAAGVALYQLQFG